METLDDLIAKLKRIRDELPEEAEKIAIKMAQDHIGVVVPRIKTEGIPGESYSDKGVPAYLVEKNPYASQSATGFARMIKQKKKSKETVSWKDVREANGRQTNFVDFSFSMTTLNSLNVVATENSGFVARAYIGSDTSEGQFRLGMGYKMYGDFLAPNEQEKDMLKNTAGTMVKNFIDKYKL